MLPTRQYKRVVLWAVLVAVSGYAAQQVKTDLPQTATQEPTEQRVNIVAVPKDLLPSNASLWVAVVFGTVSAVLATAGAIEFARRSRVDTFRSLRTTFFQLRTEK
jgi:hypothetical protein